jgi:glycosyltransferase involved in cell wall biosynthesis
MSLPNVGGNGIKDKLQLVKTISTWLKAFEKIHEHTDIIYQRFPNNLNLPGFFYFYLKKANVFATYTGTWENYKGEPATYVLQKWLLKRLFRGPVFAYLKEEAISGKIFKSFSPSYTKADWEDETEQVEKRIQRLQAGEVSVPVFITVGSLVPKKNQQYILDTFKVLNEQLLDFVLYVVGDGPLKKSFKGFIEENWLHEKIILTGKLSEAELRALYRKADFVIQATLVEGFGKVPIEGFFHGVIPLLNDISLAKEMTGNGKRGFLFEARLKEGLLKTIFKANNEIGKRIEMIRESRNYAKTFTIDTWIDKYIKTINQYSG